MKILSLVFTLLICNLNTYASSLNPESQASIYQSIYKINQFSHVNYPREVMQKFAKEQILPLFDFDYMTNNILVDLPNSEQKQWLVSRIKVDIVNTILQNLSKTKGRLLVPVGAKNLGNKIIIRLRVRNVNIDLAMHLVNESWKIFDISLRGESLINYYKKVIFSKFG